MDDGERCRAKNFYFRASEMDEARSASTISPRNFWIASAWTGTASGTKFADFSGATLAAHNLNSDRRVLEMAFGPLPNRWGLCTMYRFARVLKPRRAAV